MPEVAILLIGLGAAAALILGPLRHAAPAPSESDRVESALVRHRVAIEALRDAEADAAAGLLDPDASSALLGEAERRAAESRSDLDAALASDKSASPTPGATWVRPVAVVGAAALGVVVVVGSLAGMPGFANATVVNEGLAAARAAEAARQDAIAELLQAVAADPTDADALSDLADAYLAGSSGDDLARAAAALQLLINADPDRPDAYERLLTAYLRAGDYVNARAAHDAYARLEAADPAEAAFFDGLIALRGENDPDRALAAFETFLELAPDDPRAGMIEGLRDEAEEASGS
jgi:cytochrome c-type biogenesis protein CcmH/NrfG